MPSISAEPLSCPVCGGPGVAQAPHPEAALFRCTDCSHCYTDPRSIADPESYGPEYFAETHRNWFQNPHTALFDIIHAEGRRLGKAVSVLDVGCGKGDLLAHLSVCEPGWRLTGIDLSPNPPRNNITFIQGDIFDLSTSETYDLVTNLLVIEHIADVHSFVAALRALCRPGGMLVVTTNDEQSLLYAAARVLRKMGRSAAYDRLYSRHHLNHFSVATLRRLLEHHDLVVEKVIHHNLPLSAVDLPPAGPATKLVWSAGVRTMFGLGSLMRRTFLQTMICQVPPAAR